MDAKITMSFDKEVIEKAKKFAKSQNISLSRLTEFLLRLVVNSNTKTLEGVMVSEWVMQISEGKAEYKNRRKSRKSLRNEFLESHK